jgi:chemosensory pili system protein ChpA (sensor histidine kinase/response regulator)
VLDLGDHRAVAVVDRLVESRDVAVKPLGPLLGRVNGLAGATILGDGSVVPILDPYTFPRWDEGAARRLPILPAMPHEASAGPLEVLIVDDSLSVRRVLSNVAGNAGWVPLTARDGLEALELIQSRKRPPGVILLDIEMPRMDGFELTATLRGLPAYAGVPIVMLTSRAGMKHRAKAFGLGVSDYLVKPFEPDVLVRVVERLALAGRPA